MSLYMTTWQTVGPFFRIGLERLFDVDIAGVDVMGERIAIEGRVLDGDGIAIPDAVVEVWQANSHGKYPHPADMQDKPLEPGFKGFGRLPTDERGCFRFTTVRPGPVPGPNGKAQAPHLVIGIMMRGLLRGLVTRAYFPSEPLNDSDQILACVEPDRRSTLILKRSSSHANSYLWQIRMQGDQETVFLDF